MHKNSCEFLISGGGIVGLSIAYQLLKRGLSRRIIILDKEAKLGLHSSGRNSGVLHAGLYYKPGSLKSKVCVAGSNLLKSWIKERGLPINECGKIIVPQRVELDSQLDILAERGIANGASVEFLDQQQLSEFIPEAHTSSGRAIWSPNTAVVKPLSVVERLQNELKSAGVEILTNQKNWKISHSSNGINLRDGTNITYDYFINSSGLNADRVAHQFGVGLNYFLLPFKGIYWKLRSNCPIKISTNLYPVPDLNVPFLGVHFTPGAESNSDVSIGPTATPAFGRENYSGLRSLEPLMAINNLSLLAKQYLLNKSNFRKYVNQQAFLSFQPLFIRAAQALIPRLLPEHIQVSNKVGIRSQLFNLNTQNLEDDFLCLKGETSLHILNAISPAFTASFAFADYVIDNYLLKEINR